MNSLFGTDGIRGKNGSYPFTIEDFTNLAHAIAIWAKEKFPGNIKVLIAQDTRESCDWIKHQLKATLKLNGISVYDCNVLPIAALFHFIKHENYDICIMISASHNPYHDNGLKIISKGKKLTSDDEKKIYENLYKNKFFDYTNVGFDLEIKKPEAKYVNIVLNLFKKDLLKGLNIVLDLANGATYNVAPIIFRELGANIITINDKPNGRNINDNCGSLFPAKLQKTVIEKKYDIGFAFDGDGDRVIAVNYNGEIKDGDDILALLSLHTDYINYNEIVGTIMSNKGLEDFFKMHNKVLIRTLVGDKYVVKKMQELNTIIGGEQSGHIFLENVINTCDGIITSLKLIEAIGINKNLEMTSFIRYPQKLINLPIKTKKDLSDIGLKSIIEDSQNKLKNGRILIRYSGTENLLRIMAENNNLEEMDFVISELVTKIKPYFI